MGQLELFIGCMGSGKTTRLINRVYQLANLPFHNHRCLLIKFAIDNRFSSDDKLVTHQRQEIFPSHNITIQQIAQGGLDYLEVEGFSVVAVDEAHFSTDSLDEFVIRMWSEDPNRIVLMASVDTWFSGQPVAQLYPVFPLATKIVKKPAFCGQCQAKTAVYSSKKIQHTSETKVDVGGWDKYEPLCFACFQAKGSQQQSSR